MKSIGLELDGAVFKQNGDKLTIEEFLILIESIGLEYGGETKQINKDGEEIMITQAETYIKAIEYIKKAMDTLYCSDDDPKTIKIYYELDGIISKIKGMK